MSMSMGDVSLRFMLVLLVLRDEKYVDYLQDIYCGIRLT